MDDSEIFPDRMYAPVLYTLKLYQSIVGLQRVEQSASMTKKGLRSLAWIVNFPCLDIQYMGGKNSKRHVLFETHVDSIAILILLPGRALHRNCALC